jgi:hypothetical protein
MESITFKYGVGGASTDILPVVFYYSDYLEESEQYTDVDWDKGVEVYAEYVQLHLFFGRLSIEEMDFLTQWVRSDNDPLITLGVTDYGPLIVTKLKNQHQGGSVVCHTRAAV